MKGKKFNKIEDLEQLKSDEELIKKANEIINSLGNYTKNETFRILTSLYNSFIELCNEEGIVFIEHNKGSLKI